MGGAAAGTGEGEPLAGEGEPLAGERAPLAARSAPLAGEGAPLAGQGEPLAGQGAPLGMIWWNLAVMPPAERDRILSDTVERMNLDDAARAGFMEATREMIVRHESMFPALHAR